MRNIFKDKLLLLRLNRKDEQAFREVYDLYVDKIYRFIFFKVSGQSEAEDLTSETFLKLWQCVVEKKKIKYLNAFLYQIARNLVIDFYRERRQIITMDEVPLENEPISADEAIKIEIKLDARDLQENIRLLKEEYRDVLLLKYIEEYSPNEIAKILNKTKGNIRVLTFRAIKALQDIINKKS